MNLNSRLDQIAKEIESGANPEKYKAELDRLLETQMEDRDPVAEAVWESEYRNIPDVD